MSRILVTGSAGFIGFWTANQLASQGHSVIGIDNFNPYYDPQLKRARAKNLDKSIKVIEADLMDIHALENVLKENKVEKICHLAAQAGVRYSLQNPYAYENTNNLGTLNLLELCRKFNIQSFVYASSSSVYGTNKKNPFSEKDPVDHPISIYAATKRYNELLTHSYHHLFGIHCTGLRFFTVYGPWGRPDMALFKFSEAILKDQPIEVYNHGKMKRDFTYVKDIVSGIVSAIDKNYPYEIFNLGNSRTVELNYFIECIEKELGKKAKINLLPLQPGDVPETSADIQKAKELLGFEPKTNIEAGIREFLKWYRIYYKI
jgi:UDP-glucuronate 4-epimerase